jgi:hypothetical protein
MRFPVDESGLLLVPADGTASTDYRYAWDVAASCAVRDDQTTPNTLAATCSFAAVPA